MSLNSKLLWQGIVELLHRYSAVAVRVEALHECVLFVVRNMNIQVAKAVSELSKINEFVAVLVQFLQQVDCVLLEGREGFAVLANLT
jgi:hypothetical protein